MMYRVWQALFSVLAVGCFLALEYMRDMDVPSTAYVVCSWVVVVATWLLAVIWVAKKKYFRTLVLAALVAATRVSFEGTLSDFMKTAGWFLIGAVVLTFVVGWVLRMLRGRGGRPAEAGPPVQAGGPGFPVAGAVAQTATAAEPGPEAAAAVAAVETDTATVLSREGADDKDQANVEGGRQ